MSTATLAAPTTEARTYEKDSKTAHAENKLIGEQSGKPFVAIIGNTYPIKGVLYAFGGHWDKTAKAWMVPDHKAEEAKTLAAKFDKPAKPVDAAPAQPKPAPQVKAKAPKGKPGEDAPHNSGPNLILRSDTLHTMLAKLADDVALVAGNDPLAVKARVDLIAARLAVASALKHLKGE